MSTATPNDSPESLSWGEGEGNARGPCAPLVGVLTNRNLASPWSSTHYYAAQSLARAGAQVRHIAAEHVRRSQPSGDRSFFGRRRPRRPVGPDLPAFEKAVVRDIGQARYDVVLAMHASFVAGALEEAPCPVIYVTDATADLLQGYYPNRTDVSEEYARAIEEGERRAIRRADRVCVPTEWVAESVIERYHAAPEKVSVLEWGANLDAFPADAEAGPVDPTRPIELLFVGLDWRRKGGDIAARAADLLVEAGRPARLHVVGAEVPAEARRPYVVAHGQLNRALPDQAAKLDDLMRRADLLTHPARAECFGHVLCEALAFGTPVVATDTGGISQCVEHGESGLLLAPGSSPEEFAQAIRRLVEDPEAYPRMSRQAQADFRRRLNWDRWSSGVLDMAAELRPASGA